MPRKKKTPARATKKKIVVVYRTTKKIPAGRLTRKASKGGFSLKKMHLGMHLVIAGSAMAVLLIMSAVDRGTFATGSGNAQEVATSTIGLEHGAPLSLTILFARKDGAGYVSIENRSPDAVKISLPSDWKRTEVSGAELKNVAGELPVFGFTRWTLPAHAGIKLSLPAAPDSIFFDSASDTTAIVDMTMVDLPQNLALRKVVLVQKQALVKLWSEQE